uniref:Poly(A)-specific ribonuclease n=1 Tax=Ascaris lumbricoides TaxID=6252 RepID=A0A0M3IW96_ASCLU
MLKLIQVGFTLTDKDGSLPPSGDVWQFNFQFSLNDDMYSQESVELLRSAGIDFSRHLVLYFFILVHSPPDFFHSQESTDAFECRSTNALCLLRRAFS